MSQATTVRMPEDLYERLRRAAFEDRVPANTIVLEALTEKLNRREQEDGR